MSADIPGYGIIDILFAMVKDTIHPSLSMFKHVLGLNKLDLNTKDKDGHTLVYYSICNGHFEIIKFLFNTIKVESIDVNAGFINACYKAYYVTVQYVIANFHLDPSMVININSDAVLLASVYPKICKLILTIPGIDVNFKYNTGNTALIYAAVDNRVETCQLLLTIPEIDVNIQNKIGETALLHATNLGLVKICQLLIARPDINVNLRNIKGETPLIHAVSKEHFEICKLLLARPEIDVEIIYDHTFSLMEYVRLKVKNRKIKELFKKYDTNLFTDILEPIKKLFMTNTAVEHSKTN